MTTINRKCTYPDVNPNLRKSGGQLPFKNHIKEFDQLLKDIGLIRTTTTGQLDTNNIEDLDLSLCFTSLSSYWNYNTNQSVWYAPLEYAFDDSLQSLYPVIIKFEFFFFRAHIRTILDVTEMPHFGCRITISGQVTPIVLWQIPSFHASLSPSTSQTWTLNNYATIYKNRESYICYDKQKGYLYINYCPSLRYTLGGQSTASIPLNSSIHLLINRSKDNFNNITDDYIKVISQIPNTNYNASFTYTTNSNGSLSTNRSVFYYYISPYAPPTPLYQSDIGFQTPYSATINYNNGQFYTYMTTNYDASNSALKYDPFVLIGNKDMSTALTGLIYNIKINDTETKKYLCISQDDTGGYPYSANQVMLVYYN